LIEEGTNIIKIIDFGFAVFTNDGSGKVVLHKIFCGTPSYMAPELTRKMEYDAKKVDMWALGVLIFVILIGKFPFSGQNENELFHRIKRVSYKIPPDMIAREAKEIIKSLLVLDTKARLRADELYKNEWINSSNLPLTIFEKAGKVMRISEYNYKLANYLKQIAC